MTRRRRLLGVAIAALLSLSAAGCCITGIVSMPGEPFRGEPPPLAGRSLELQAQLSADIATLSTTIGERNATRRPAELRRARDFLVEELTAMGYTVEEQPYEARRFRGGALAPVAFSVANLIVERRGTTRPAEIVVVGAHYDSAEGTPGADDNATGVAATLALARAFAGKSTARTVRFVFFTNEEPPWFNGDHMGSEVYARRCRERGDDVVAMVSLETMGFFRDEPGTQHYPWPLSAVYPSEGSFIGFVADTASQALVHDAVKTFRAVATVPSEGASIPASITGADWSDHGPFWRQGYRAFMVTDTALFRNPHYHEPTDVIATLDVEALVRTVEGLQHVVEHLATTPDRW